MRHHQIKRFAVPAMGTRFELLLVASMTDTRLQAAAEAAMQEIEDQDQQWSRFRNDSFLAFLQRQAPRRSVSLTQDQGQFLGLCQAVAKASEGAFDIALADWMDGHDVPAAPESRAGAEHIVLADNGRSVRFTSDRVRLDFGAVAKGWALDRARTCLQELGVTAAILHGGTSCIVAWGAPEGEPWCVALRNPNGPGWLAKVELRDMALAISGQQRQQIRAGQRGHILCPASGEIVRGVELTAVYQPSAALADAWSTALFVSGQPHVRAGTCLIKKSGLEPIIVGPHHAAFQGSAIAANGNQAKEHTL